MYEHGAKRRNKMNYETLQEVVYQAFLKAIQETGDDYKQMSWFPRNKPDIFEATYEEVVVV